jgi:phosphoribosylaminoimidazolecarboxamide formyltransferase/IMP cyclohydrolase
VRALISTWDKSGLDTFARGLVALGWRLVASGNTAGALEAIGLPVERVEAVTESPEMLGGRVKTLHPRVHAGILARRDEADDVATLEEHGIEAFDLVCVNLYPFESFTAQRGVTETDAVEMIDIGGPSMLRGAAKNFAHCAPVCRPDQYGPILEELRSGGELSLGTRRRLAAEAFAHTAAYEAAIATWFNAREEFPDALVVSLDKVLDLAYGENPHQRAAYYAERGVRRHLLSRVEQLHGKELSFNNLNDFSAARSLAREFKLPACVIVKHANPCGVAVGTTVEEAYDKALASDPTSAYGGVVVLNREVEESLGEKLAEQFVEVLFAPGYTEDALNALRRKKNTRILLDGERRAGEPGERSYKRVLGGLLVQDSDAEVEDQLGARHRRAERGTVGRPRLRLARVQARRLERDRAREGPADDRDRRRPDEPGRRGADRSRESSRARPRREGLGARVRRVLPLPRRPADRARRRHDLRRPARRLTPRRRRDRRRRRSGRCDGLHRPPALPALAAGMSIWGSAVRLHTMTFRDHWGRSS